MTFEPDFTEQQRQCITISANKDTLYEGLEKALVRVDTAEEVIVEPEFSSVDIIDINSEFKCGFVVLFCTKLTYWNAC